MLLQPASLPSRRPAPRWQTGPNPDLAVQPLPRKLCRTRIVERYAARPTSRSGSSNDHLSLRNDPRRASHQLRRHGSARRAISPRAALLLIVTLNLSAG